MTRIAASLACVIAFGCRPNEPKPVPQSDDLTPGATSASAVRLESLPDTYPTALMAELHGADTFVTATFRRVLGSAPRLGWFAPSGFIAEEQHLQVYIWSTDSVIQRVRFSRSLSDSDHAQLAAESHLACDTKGPLTEYGDSVLDMGARQRAFYTAGAPPVGTRVGMVGRTMSAAERARAHAVLGPPDTSGAFLDTAFAASLSGPFYSIDAAYDSSRVLRMVALILHDSSGAIIARQLENGFAFGCDGCDDVTYEAGIERLYDVENVFVIPGFPYPVLLLDTSTVEGRALSLVTFTPDGYYATYRIYEYVVNCILGG